MVNNIGRNNPVDIKIYNTQTSNARVKDKTISKENSLNSSQDDQVSLSSIARDVTAAKKQLAELPEIRNEKINEIKIRLSSGNYKIDSNRIANCIIKESLLNDLS